MRTTDIVATVLLAFVATLAGAEPGRPVDLLDKVPYRDEAMGSRKVADEKHVLMMQIALKPGQSVPEHKANSNVHVIVLKGAVVLALKGTDVPAREGCLVPVAFDTPMQIRNDGVADATFLVVKTPNPSELAPQPPR